MGKITITECDVCNAKNPEHMGKTLQVIFVSKQTEGRPSSPYLCNKTIDLCEDCMARLLEGHYIFATGAKGYNRYYFKPLLP